MRKKDRPILNTLEEAVSTARLLGDMRARHIHETISVIHDLIKQTPDTDPFSLWKKDAPSKAELTSYVESVTNKNSRYHPKPGHRN